MDKNKRRAFIKQRIATVFYQNSKIADESVLINVKRIFYLSFVVIPSRILDITLFKNTELSSKTWSDLIIAAHIVLLIIWIAILLLSYLIMKKDKASIGAKILQYIVPVSIMISGIVVTAIDQLVTPNISPFMMVCIVTGIIFLLRPLVSIAIFISSYLLFFYSMSLTIANEQILLSNRVNGITAVVLGLFISIMAWYYNHVNMVQKSRIEIQQDQLRQMAYHDPLTGIYNRHFFNKIIRKEYSSIERYGHESAIIFLDLDDFKDINDRYGHLVGDQVLKQFSKLLVDNIREADTLVRFGGEEFVILAPNTLLDNGILFAEKLRRIIEENTFNIDDNSLKVTASLGVTSLVSRNDNELENCLSVANKAMYLAKSKGKNRVEKV